jgi:hypothetical protein
MNKVHELAPSLCGVKRIVKGRHASDPTTAGNGLLTRMKSSQPASNSTPDIRRSHVPTLQTWMVRSAIGPEHMLPKSVEHL